MGPHLTAARLLAVTALLVTSCSTPAPSPSGGEPHEVSTTSMPAATARWGGEDRYATAIAVSGASFPEGSDLVVLANGERFPDALVGAPLAHAFSAPVLLTRPSSVPEPVLAEMARLGASTVVVLGGEAVVSPQVVTQLESARLAVRRVSGDDRFTTAAEAATTMVSPLQTGGTVLVASGEDFPDAIAAGALASARGEPLLLASTAGLSSATRRALVALDPREVVVVGGRARLNDTVLSAVQAAAPAAEVIRLAGADRYETSAAVAALTPGTVKTVVLASGVTFPDALTASALGLPVLLTPGPCVPPVVAAQIDALAPGQLVAVGGALAVGPGAAAGSLCPAH